MQRAVPVLIVTLVVVAGSVYANLSFAVTNPADYRFFPPFWPGVNANRNRELGSECFHIAQALAAGRGFADPFQAPTGPTAWMPPLLPSLLAGMLWLCDRDQDAVVALTIFLQACILIGTGLLVLALARQTSPNVSPTLVAGLFAVLLVSQFHRCFQYFSDTWLVLLMMDLVVAGCCWWQPLAGWRKAIAWGLLGGVSALASPVVGFTWAVFTCRLGRRRPEWARLAVAAVVALLITTPWTVRNYFVFGRLVPVKSNLPYELYQSQCLQPDGLLRWATFHSEAHEVQVREYRSLGEPAFVERKERQFLAAVRADPFEFIQRLFRRCRGATLWYEPYYPHEESWIVWTERLIHPLPFLGLLVLLATARRPPLQIGRAHV